MRDASLQVPSMASSTSLSHISSRPPLARPSKLLQPTLKSQTLPHYDVSRESPASSTMLKRSANDGDVTTRSGSHRSRLAMSCVSGRRSPTSPATSPEMSCPIDQSSDVNIQRWTLSRPPPSPLSYPPSTSVSVIRSSEKNPVTVDNLDQHALIITGDIEEQTRSRTLDSKKRVVKDRSPVTLWRSISSSSLVRSLSRRRSKSLRRSMANGSDAVGATLDGNRKTISSSVDTEDSDADVLDTEGQGHAVSSDVENTRQSRDATKTKRRSFFSRSFRRSKSTPAEEFVVATKASDEEQGKAETERLPRKRMTFRSKVSSTNDVNRMTSSSRAASWASLKRSSESFTSSKRGLSRGVFVVTVLKLSEFMIGKWISAMAYNPDRQELIIVDFRAAYVIDVSNCVSGAGYRLVRRITGPKGATSDRLIEPIGVAIAVGGGVESRLVFTDRSDQSVKVYSGRGHHIRTAGQLGLSNIGGVGVDAVSSDVYVAGTDGRRVVVCRNVASSSSTRQRKHQHQETTVSSLPVSFQHPYSVALNPLNGDVIIGDDYAQEVVALAGDGQSVKWNWTPHKSGEFGNTESSESGAQTLRPFFPSSICADTGGRVFIADLYNEAVYMLDCSTSEACPVQLLSKRSGLKGGPLSLAIDESQRHLYVADEERTVRVFNYSNALLTASRRRTNSEESDRPFSFCSSNVEIY